MAYTPGLQVSASSNIRRVRELPLPGEVLVSLGDRVKVDDIVLKTELPGEVDIIRLADRMGLDPLDVKDGVKVKEGTQVKPGDLLCEVETFWGLFRSSVHSPLAGKIEFYTETNAHLGIRNPSIPLEVKAYISGVVVDIEAGKSITIESNAALIQGIFGVGGEAHGKILVLPQEGLIDQQDLKDYEIEGSILIGGSSFSIQALKYAASRGAAAIITGSVSADTLRQYVGYEIGVSITGDEAVPFPFIITEGFGELAMSSRILDLAKTLQGKEASINGTTQVRAGAMRPELIVCNQESPMQSDSLPMVLEPGRRIRLIRVPYFGAFATVEELPKNAMEVQSGACVRVLTARLDSGEVVVVPRANVELV